MRYGFDDWSDQMLERARPVSRKTLAGVELLRMTRLLSEEFEALAHRFNSLCSQVEVADLPKLLFIWLCPKYFRHELFLVQEGGKEGSRNV